jgi:hypothetical protein
MNYRILNNGKQISEPEFQAIVETHRARTPGITEEEVLALLNKARTKTVLQHPGDPDQELKPVKKLGGRVR